LVLRNFSIVYALVKDEVQILHRLSFYSIEQILAYTGSMTIKLLAGLGVFMAVIAGADYFFQRWDLKSRCA
jgi:flagellar biosynthetic protein FlhB